MRLQGTDGTSGLPVGDANGLSQLHNALGHKGGVLPAGVAPAQHRREAGFGARKGDILPGCQQPGQHPQDIAVHRRLRLAVGNGGYSTGSIVAYAGQLLQLRRLLGKPPAVLLHDLHCRLFQVPCPAVIAQPLPQLH